MTWREWTAIWLAAIGVVAVVVGWAFLCEAVMSEPWESIAGLGVPLIVLFVALGLTVTR